MEREINETYLGFIQNIIDRMGQNSFHAKEWCVTVISALMAFYITQDGVLARPLIAAIAAVVTILFAFIDAYYLHLERGYRYLYKVAVLIEEDDTIKPLSMSRPMKYRGAKPFFKALFSLSTGLFYLVILIGIFFLYLFTV